MASPKTKDWSAISKTDDFAGRNPHVEVKGMVEVGRSNQNPVLKKRTPGGINPSILILVLEIVESGDVGNDVMIWKDVSLKEPVSTAMQYRSVSIQFESTEIASLEVVHRPS